LAVSWSIVMPARRLRSRLFLLTTVAGVGSLGWEGYGPHGYRYEFSVASRTVDESELPDEQRWEGYAVEWRGHLALVNPQGGAAMLTRAGDMPVRGDASLKGRPTIFRTHRVVKELGEGETAGIRARRYLLTADETLFVRTGGSRRRVLRTTTAETEVWVAAGLRGDGGAFLHLVDSISLLAAGRTPRAVRSLHAAAGPLPFEGMPLKLVANVVVFDSIGRRRQTVTTGQVLGLRRGWVNAQEIGGMRAAAPQGLDERLRGREVAAGEAPAP